MQEGRPNPLRVVLLDDEPGVRRSLSRVLQGAGWLAEEAASGVEALRIVDRDPPDVVLTDLPMPGMDSIEFVKESRRLAPDVPVILMTSPTEIPEAAAALRAGAADYLTKPIEVDAILDALQRAVSQARVNLDARGGRWQREITEALTEARLDAAEVAQTLARRTADAIGDLCIVLLAGPGEELTLAACCHRDRELEAWLQKTLQAPWSASEELVARFLAAEETILMRPTAEEAERFWAVRGAAASPQRFDASSVVVCQLRARGAVIGLLLCARGPGQRPYRWRERVLVSDVAARASLWLDNARLFRSLQEQLRRTEEAQAALRVAEEQLGSLTSMESLGRLASGVVHDFNNVLSVVIGQADLLLEEEPGTDSMRTRLAGILKAAQHGAALTSRILDAGRKSTIELRVIDLDEALRGMADMLQQVAGPGVDVVFELGSSPAHVKADPTGLQQVLMNLVINARDAMPGRGRVTVQTRYPATISSGTLAPAGPAEDFVELSVSDSGVGMDEATLARIFEPFFSTKGPGRGHGLGLPTVLGIVEQSGARMGVESRPGEGTAFRIHFPYSPAPQRRRSSRPRIAAQKAEAILVVVEDPDMRALLERILGRAGYAVVSAGGVAEARATREAVALVLADSRIGGPEGDDLLRTLRRASPRLRVLVLPAGAEADAAAAQAGSGLLPLPVTRETLLRKVRGVLGE